MNVLKLASYLIFYVGFPVFILYLELSFLISNYKFSKGEEFEYEDNKKDEDVAIIIPVRNEEDIIESCILSIQESSYPIRSIVVVDDQSEDATAYKIKELQKEDARIKLISIEYLPAGWIGKNYALYKGVCESQSDWIFFIDADVLIDYKAIEYVIYYMKSKGIDLFSFSPYQICEKFYDNLIQPSIFNLLNYLFPLDAINTGKNGLYAINGSFIAIKRSDYLAIGGHQAVKGEVLEDVKFAKLAASKGYKIELKNGYPFVKSRMYRKLSNLWEGWSKNIYFLIQESNKKFMVVFLRFFIIYLYPIIFCCFTKEILLTSAIIISMMTIESIVRYRNRMNWVYGVLYVISGIMVLLIMVNSYINLGLLERAKWKKRTYRIKNF